MAPRPNNTHGISHKWLWAQRILTLYFATLVCLLELYVDWELNVICMVKWPNIKIFCGFLIFPNLFILQFIIICTNMEGGLCWFVIWWSQAKAKSIKEEIKLCPNLVCVCWWNHMQRFIYQWVHSRNFIWNCFQNINLEKSLLWETNWLNCFLNRLISTN